jgi:hypothetical protein
MLATTWTKLEAMSTLRSTGAGVGDGVGLAVGAFLIDMVGAAVGLKVEVGDVVGVALAVVAGEGVGVEVGEGLVLFENVPVYTRSPADEAKTIIAASAMAINLFIMQTASDVISQ